MPDKVHHKGTRPSLQAGQPSGPAVGCRRSPEKTDVRRNSLNETGFRFSRTLATDRRRIVQQEVSGAAMRVVRVSDLSRRRAGLERLALDRRTRVMTQQTRVQVRTEIQPALLPTHRPRDASGSAVAAARAAVARFVAQTAQQARATAALVAVATVAAAALAGARIAAAPRVVVQASGGASQQTHQRSDHKPTIHSSNPSECLATAAASFVCEHGQAGRSVPGQNLASVDKQPMPDGFPREHRSASSKGFFG